MEAPRKRKRRGGDDDDAAGCPGGDRLSALPDSLLHEIMSRLKARQVVQTCVLSTRWRHLWRSVPCLDVDQEDFTVAADGYAGIIESWQKFEDFCDILLTRHVSVALLDAFRLRVTGYSFSEHRLASRWIRRAITDGAREPGIQRRQGLNPRSWRLKTLRLTNLCLDGLFADHVRSGCPSLEDLELRDCTCEFRAVASDSLKILALKRCRGIDFSEITCPALKNLVVDHGSNVTSCLFVITAPAVADLSLSLTPYNFGAGVSLSEMASVARASIQLVPSENTVFRGDVFKILCRVSNAKSLDLSGFETMVLGEESKTFPEFKNLRTIRWASRSLCDDLQILGHLVQNSPNLEKLTLRCPKVFVEGSCSYPEFKNLRTLLLENCDLSDDFQTLGHFLQNSPSLEKLTLRHCKFSNDTKKKKGTSKMKNTPSTQCRNLLDVRCENLRLTEIIYEDDDVHQLVELLLRISRNLPNNNIRLTKVDSCY